MLRTKIFICTIILALLGGCGPVFQTNYSYVPPRSPMSKMCINQCVQNQSICEQMCQMKNQSCRIQAHQDALYQYESYKHEQERLGLPINKSVSSFEYSGQCEQQCGCTASFNTCYSACGGKVLESRVCVAFCNTRKS